MVPLFPAECGVSSVLRYPAAEFRDFVCYQPKRLVHFA